MDPLFISLYLLGFAFLLTVELIGIRRRRPGDTVTEGWQWIDRHLPAALQWGWRVLSAGVLAWLLLHLAGPWK